MKKVTSILLILTLVLVFSLTACFGGNIDYSIIDNDKIKIGVIVDSDEFINLEESIISGIEYAHSLAPSVNINENYSIELIIKDSSSDIESAANELIEEKTAAVICLASNDSNSEEVIEAFNKTSIPIIFIDTITDTIQSQDNLFSLSISSEYQVSALNTYISGKGYTKGAVVCSNDNSYSMNFADLLISSLNSTTTKFIYSGENADFSAGNITSAGNDFLFVIGNLADSLSIYGELIDSGFSGEIIFSEKFDKTHFESVDYNGLTFISKFEQDDVNFIGTDFINIYSDTYDISSNKITSSVAYGYDAYMLIYDALSSFNPLLQNSILSSDKSSTQTSEDTENTILTSDLTKAIQTTQHMGATDSIVFNERGTVQCNFLYINTIENSNCILVDRYNFKNN